MASELTYRKASPEDLPQLAELEAASYPEDEAATPNTIKFRIGEAADFFLVAELREDSGAERKEKASASAIVGFVNGTLLKERKLAAEAMKHHDPRGTVLAIHSVVTNPRFRRRGWGQAMLREYIRRFENASHAPDSALSQVDELVLLAHRHLLPFYEAVGFRTIGPSEVVHGKETWFECRYAVKRGK